MDATEFKKLVTKHFTTDIRELGWKGSGFNFRRLNDNHVVDIFGIQGSWYGGSVCCETAIHFDFLRDLTYKPIDITKTTYASCIIRKRLSPKGNGDFHWTFRDKEEDNVKSISQILEAFKTHGMKFYQAFSNFPHPFDKIQPGDLIKNTNYQILNKYYVTNQIHLTWLLKEINIFIGRRDIGKEFSELGMTKSIEHAESMSKQFKSKSQQNEIQKYIDANRDLFRI